MNGMIHPRVVRTAAHVRDHYDELDRPYREIWGEHVHHGYWRTGRETPGRAVEALVDLVMERLDIRPGQHIGDIGCGYGASAAYILSRHDVGISGFTLSPVQAKIAGASRPERGRFTCFTRDWLANGLPDAGFDRLYAIESSEHFEDKAAFFQEAARSLRPGGRLVVCSWLADEAPGALAVRFLLEPICREGALPGMGTAFAYQALARAAGLRLISHEDLSPWVRKTWIIVAWRILGKFLTSADYRRLAFDPALRNRPFLFSVPRLWLALRTGAMHYGLSVWEKPALPNNQSPASGETT